MMLMSMKDNFDNTEFDNENSDNAEFDNTNSDNMEFGNENSDNAEFENKNSVNDMNETVGEEKIGEEAVSSEEYSEEKADKDYAATQRGAELVSDAKELYEEAKAKADAFAGEMEQNIKQRAKKVKAEVEEDVDAFRGQRKNRRKIGFLSGIRFKITAAFIVPVVLMVGLGVISYTRSAEALTANYESASKSTVDTTADYMDMVIETIRNVSYDMSVSSLAREYYGGTYSSDSYKESSVYNTLKSEIDSRRLGNKYIKNIVFTAKHGKGVSTAVSYTPEPIYDEFRELEAAKTVDKEDTLWLGTHPEVDELMETSGYAFGILRKAYNSSFRQVGYLLVDVDLNKIQQNIASVNMGTNAIVALITPDGREISYRNISGGEESNMDKDSLDVSYIVGTDLYDRIKGYEEKDGSEYVEFEGEQYLMLYNKLDADGFMVVSLVPKSYIIADANQTAVLTVFAVCVTALIVILIGLVLSTSIGTTIRKIMNGLERASTGDLTVDIRTRRKDEFMILCESTNQMISNIRTLLDKADTVSKAVGKASESVGGNSGILLEETKSITSSIAEVEQGIVMQAQDAENCLTRMDDLSKKIEIVSDNTNKIAEIADNTKGIVSDGLGTIEQLKDKAKATTQVTSEVISNIQDLEEASKSIAKIIGAINDIADETSLLSLNASIEAARAGDAGRGFAVVADSIRKLAEQSLNSVNEIRGIVGKIQKQTVDTVEVAKQAEVIVNSQEEALKNTIDVFRDIDKHVSGLADNLSEISSGINDMDVAKRETLSAIESISAVAQETASSATEVNEAASRQLEAVEKLNNESEELIVHSEALVEAINKFII